MDNTIEMFELPKCNFCKNHDRVSDARYDAKTIYGFWAYMCQDHWMLYGIGQLGRGKGQKLNVSKDA